MSYRISLLMLLTLFACSQKSLEDAPQSYPLETARMVSHVSGGVLASTDPIRVRFVSPVVGKSQVGQVLRTRVFRFVPSIDGLATWEDVRTLVFKPNAPLVLRTVYSGELSMTDLFPQHKDLKPLVIQFEVAGRELVALEADFELPDANDPQRLVFSGQISFNERADSSAVSDAVALRLGDQQLALHWRMLSDGETHDFTSSEITRTGESRELAMHIDRADLDLSQDYDNTWTLPPLSTLSVVEIEKHTDRDRPSVSIIFSDDLDLGQAIAGLITADPPQQLQLTAIGKTVSVVGDFQHGQRYALTVPPRVRSRWGVALAQPHRETVAFDDIKPRMRFARDGVFLPTSGNRKIRFQTVNVSRVHLKIQKVFESNLGQFLQDQKVDGSRDRTRVFSSYQIRRVGVTVADTTLDIGNQKNVWLQHELDLNDLISKDEKGLYLIGLTFGAEDMLYGDPVEAAEARQLRRRYRGAAYWNNPYSRGYVYQHGRIYKPVVVSDIGLTHQKTHDRHLVYATHLEDARPLSGVTVTLRTYQNQVVEQKVTDRNGLADFGPVESDVFYIEAEKDGQRSFIKPGDMAWNLSTFDTGGRVPAPDGIRAFFYTERGVYRPGDDIHLSANVPAVRLLYEYGVVAFYERLRAAGLTTLFRTPNDYGLPLVLGGAEVTGWDMAVLFRGLGNGGVFQPLHINPADRPSEPPPLLSRGACYLVLNTLRDLSRPGIEFYWHQFQNQWPIAWKTGTSYGHRDAWAVGVSPQWTIAVWVGNFTGEGVSELTGGCCAAPLLFDLFNSLPRDPDQRWFAAPQADLIRRDRPPRSNALLRLVQTGVKGI